MHVRKSFALLVGLAFIASLTKAQDLPQDISAGLQPYQSYHGGDLDQVNLENGNLHIKIPIISYPQRGGKLKLDYALEFNGKPQSVQPVCTIGDNGTMECNDFAWIRPSLNIYSNWHVVDEQDVTTTGHTVVVKRPPLHTDSYGNVVWITADGASHPGATVTSVSGQTGQVSLDGSGFYSGTLISGTCTSHCYTSDANGSQYPRQSRGLDCVSRSKRLERGR